MFCLYILRGVDGVRCGLEYFIGGRRDVLGVEGEIIDMKFSRAQSHHRAWGMLALPPSSPLCTAEMIPYFS